MTLKENMKKKLYKIYAIIQIKESADQQVGDIVEVSLWKRNLEMTKRKGQKVKKIITNFYL